MAPPVRRDHMDLTARLRTEPYRFRFFQAIRVLKLTERAAGRKAARPRRLRFRTPLTLNFPPSELLRFESAKPRTDAEAAAPEARPEEMEVSFLGLTGPSGVLPHHYTELLMDRRLVHRDNSAHAFLDLFSHRATSLFYDAWEKYRFHIGYEMGARGGFTQHLLDLLGTGRPPRQETRKGSKERPLATQILAYFSGALGRRPLPSSSLTGLIATYFGVPVRLEQFVGQWIEAPAEEQSGLGSSGSALGVSTVLGQRLWDRQTKIRLRIGPLDSRTFTEFQPGRSAAVALRQMVELCLGQSLNCDVTLVLKKEAAPESVMTSDAPVPLSLGINTWARTAPPEQDLDDVRYRLL